MYFIPELNVSLNSISNSPFSDAPLRTISAGIYQLYDLLSQSFDQSLDTDSDIDHEEENVGVKVLKERLAILERTAPDQVKQDVFDRCKQFVDEFVSLVAEARDDLDFLVDLVIAASRPWEAWTSSEGPSMFPMKNRYFTVSDRLPAVPTLGHYCFPDWVGPGRFINLTSHIIDNLGIVKSCFNGVILQDLTADEKALVSNAHKTILENKNVVEKIRKLPETELEEFLDDVCVRSFASKFPDRSFANTSLTLDTWMDGLSSFDGKRAYVSERMISISREAAKRIIEHELMQNISRWRLDCPRLISPAKNNLLRSLDDNQMIEAGDFYEEQVYQMPKQDPSPFGLTRAIPIRRCF